MTSLVSLTCPSGKTGNLLVAHLTTLWWQWGSSLLPINVKDNFAWADGIVKSWHSSYLEAVWA